MKLQDLENIEDYYIDEGFLCIKLISGDHLRINFNSIEAIKKQFSIPDVVKSLPQDNYCNVCNLPTDGEKCYSKQCPV
tara:strand:+ start:996 stop:1229 length:234 start_codon:yes stop_codon:yes gene_type:complete